MINVPSSDTAQAEVLMSGRHRLSGGAQLTLMDKAWLVEPKAIIFSTVLAQLRATLRNSTEALVRLLWRQADDTGAERQGVRPSVRWVRRVQAIICEMGWVLTDSPYVFDFRGEQIDLTSIDKGKLGHLVRDAWRCYMMATTKTTRHIDVTVRSLDTKVLQEFIDSWTGHRDRPWAWRCCVGAEPSADRLHYLDSAVDYNCAVCRVPNTTKHRLWECPCTLPERQRRQLPPPPEVTAGLSESARNAFLLNGWIPDALGSGQRRHVCRWCHKILFYKFTVLGEFYDRFRAIAAASGREADSLDPGEDSA